MSSPTSDRNPKTLDVATVRENLNYIAKFGLPPSVAQHIDYRLILNNVHIDDPTTASDIELNSWVFNCLESYQLRPTLVIHRMLKVFRDEFHGWGYTEFSKLDQHIRGAFKEIFMAKGIYLGTPNGHINQQLANLVIDEQLPIWDKIELQEYKAMYPTSKAWVLLELRHSYPPQPLKPFIEVKINFMDDRRQQSFTPRPANARGSITPIKEPLAQIPPVQALPIPTYLIQVSIAKILPILAATIQTPLSVPLVLSLPVEHGHGRPKMHPEHNKHADAQLSAYRQKQIEGLLEKDVFKVGSLGKVVKPGEIPSSTQGFDSRSYDDIKDLCIDKARERSRPVIYAYNDEKKNIVLGHSSQIPGVTEIPGVIQIAGVSQGLRNIT